MNNQDLWLAVMGRSLFPLLHLNEGVAVHYEGKGYIVAKLEDEDTHEVQIKVLHDDDMLNQMDLTMLWLHDEPVGNA